MATLSTPNDVAQNQEEDEEDTDLFATDEVEPSDRAEVTAANVEQQTSSSSVQVQHLQEDNHETSGGVPPYSLIDDTAGIQEQPAESARPRTPEGEQRLPLAVSLQGTPKSEDAFHVPRKSQAESPFSPQKPTLAIPAGVPSLIANSNSKSNVSATHNPLHYGLPAEVTIPPSVDVSLLQGRLLETLRNLPLQLINDALVEYDDAVQIKGEAIRNRGAYLFGVIKRYVNVQERAARGETPGSQPMGPDLTPAVQERLNKLVEKGFCSDEEMNDKIKSKIRMLSEKDALFAVDELASVERYQIRNFGSYFMGILNRYMRGEAPAQGGGGAAGGGVKPKSNEFHKGPQQFDERRKFDRQQHRGRSPERDHRGNIGRDRYGEPFRRERSRDRFDQQQQQQQHAPPQHHQYQNHSQQQKYQPQQQGDRSRRFRNNEPESFRRTNDSFVDRSRYDPRQQQEPPPQQNQYMGGQQQQHRQPQEPPMMSGFVHMVPPPPPRSNPMGVPGMNNNYQQQQQQYMPPHQNQPMGAQPGGYQQSIPLVQQQQQFVSPHGIPNPSYPGQPQTNPQQNFSQPTSMMNQQYGNQPQQPPMMLNQQPPMMNQQTSRPATGGNLQTPQSSYMGNQMQPSMGNFQQQQTPAMMNAPSPQNQHLSYQQQQPVMGVQQQQQQQPLQGSYQGGGPPNVGGWPQSQTPVDILGLADKAASAVQALAAGQNKYQVAPPYAPSAPVNMSSSSLSSYGMPQQQPPSSVNPYGNQGIMNTNQYDLRQPSGPPQPPQNYQNQQTQNNQRRARTTAALEDLPVNVQYAIQNLMATQQVEGPLDSGMLGMIKDLPEPLALASIQKFMSIDKNTMRSKTAYLAGVLRRELEKINLR